MVANSREETDIGDYEVQLLSIPNHVRIELILVHPNHYCPSGLTKKWLGPRPWISQHHHIMLPTGRQRAKSKGNWRLPDMNWAILADQLMTQGFRRTLRNLYNTSNDTDYSYKDIERLSRRVLGKSVGLVLGGGGARGIAHLGVIKTLVQSGVPIDAVGGTSIGALVSGLFARDGNFYTSSAFLRVFSALMSSKWRLAYDMTYPFCAWFTGESFNRALWKIFEERLIEDMWIPFFCITTDVSSSKMRVHQSGLTWRAIRASMSLSGFLPPLWEEGNTLLLDGGYTNNLPVDVMLSVNSSIATVIAVDVSSERTGTDGFYEDEVSGLWLLFKSLFGMKVAVPSLADIQSRLAYVSCVEHISKIKETALDPSSGIFYLRPPVQPFATLEFDKFDRIFQVGESYAQNTINFWQQDGTLAKLKGVVWCPSEVEVPAQSEEDGLDMPSCVRSRRRSL